MSPIWLATIAAMSPPPIPDLTVAQVRADGGMKGRRVVIWAFRGGKWASTVEVDSDVVQWHRLLPDDRVEVVR